MPPKRQIFNFLVAYLIMDGVKDRFDKMADRIAAEITDPFEKLQMDKKIVQVFE